MSKWLDSRKEYPSIKAFARDERRMARDGWTTESISVTSQPARTWWLRLRRGHSGLGVKAHYFRLIPAPPGDARQRR